jgi:hypothetical protein
VPNSRPFLLGGASTQIRMLSRAEAAPKPRQIRTGFRDTDSGIFWFLISVSFCPLTSMKFTGLYIGWQIINLLRPAELLNALLFPSIISSLQLAQFLNFPCHVGLS